MDTLIVIIVFLLCGIFILRPQIKQKRKKEYWFNIVVFLVGFVVLLLVSLEVPFPTPTSAIQNAIQEIFPFTKKF